MTAPPPTSLVLIGCGAVSQLFYTPTIEEAMRSGRIRRAWLVDPEAPARHRVGQRLRDSRQAATLDGIQSEGPTLAIIASPPRFHASATVEALARGWHVLCEKPMAGNSRECEAMIAAAREAGRVLAVGHYKRFFPASRQLYALCQGMQPLLGALRSVSIVEGGPFSWPAASPSFFRREETPGGVLLDIGIHVLDLLGWWLGEPLSFTYADDAMGGLETNAVVQLQYLQGIDVRVRLSRDWITANVYRFVFERGVVTWRVNDANGLTVEAAGLPHGMRATLLGDSGEPAYTNAQSFIAQLLHVLDAIEHGTPVLVDGAAGARALKLVEACYARREPLPQPWLSPQEQTRAAQLAGCEAASRPVVGGR